MYASSVGNSANDKNRLAHLVIFLPLPADFTGNFLVINLNIYKRLPNG